MSEGFYSLQEFMSQTKGVLYLLAIGSLVSFVLFWRFIHERDKKEE